MDKVFTFLMITIAVSLLLNLAGLGSSLNTFSLIESLTSGDFVGSPLWIAILVVFAGIGLAVAYQSVIAGNAGAAIATGQILMTVTLVTYLTDLIAVLGMSDTMCDHTLGGLCGITYQVIRVLMILLAIGFAWSLAEFVFGGGD